MSHALALVAEEESTLAAGPATVDATITVTAEGSSLSFSSSSSQVTVQGTDLTLQPASGHPSTTFNLLFVASTGIASFRTPAAEIILGNKVSYPVYPNSGDSSFTLSFRNNLQPGNPQASFSFIVFWNGSSLNLVSFESEDPTILLDPPKS